LHSLVPTKNVGSASQNPALERNPEGGRFCPKGVPLGKITTTHRRRSWVILPARHLYWRGKVPSSTGSSMSEKCRNENPQGRAKRRSVANRSPREMPSRPRWSCRNELNSSTLELTQEVSPLSCTPPGLHKDTKLGKRRQADRIGSGVLISAVRAFLPAALRGGRPERNTKRLFVLRPCQRKNNCNVHLLVIFFKPFRESFDKEGSSLSRN
jgi:hypothetical protein